MALREELGLNRRQAIHWVTLLGQGAVEELEPARLEVEPGDVVIFETGDWRVHTLAFLRDRMSPEALDFMERTGQLESPPLVTLGSRFAVTFEDAPEAVYPFRSEGGGGAAEGVVDVRVPSGGR
jgi:plastocyanin